MKTPTKRVKYTNEILIQNMDKTPENSRRNSHMANLSNAKIEPMVNDSSFIYSANKPPVSGNRATVKRSSVMKAISTSSHKMQARKSNHLKFL